MPAIAPDVSRSLALLIADDGPENRDLYRCYLRHAPVRADYASDGLEAVALFAARRYDLVILDIEMPGIDGFEAARTMRRWERASGAGPVPIVALTTLSSLEVVERCLAAGCSSYQSKPICKVDFMRLLRMRGLPARHGEGGMP